MRFVAVKSIEQMDRLLARRIFGAAILLLGHKSRHVTTHCSAPEVGVLIEAAEKVRALQSRKSHAFSIVRGEAARVTN
jgi:aminoglycoside phosphotransferase